MYLSLISIEVTLFKTKFYFLLGWDKVRIELASFKLVCSLVIWVARTDLTTLCFLPFLLVQKQERLRQVDILVDIYMLLTLVLHETCWLCSKIMSLRNLPIRFIFFRNQLCSYILCSWCIWNKIFYFILKDNRFLITSWLRLNSDSHEVMICLCRWNQMRSLNLVWNKLLILSVIDLIM